MKHKSIVFYSMHRSGSTAQIDILKWMAKYSGMHHAYLAPPVENYNLKKRTNDVHDVPPNLIKMFGPYNNIYGPFRRFTRVPVLDDAHLVLSIRDPRDTLVSLYYSNAYYHSPPPDPKLAKAFLADRKRCQEIGIDRFCLSRIKPFMKIYEAYRKASEQHPMLILTYAEMTTNYRSYMRKLLKHCGLEHIHDKMMILEKSFKPPRQENVSTHKRQYLPGDYKRKLKPHTQQVLTQEFKLILNWVQNNK